jgi:hypothetical protein
VNRLAPFAVTLLALISFSPAASAQTSSSAQLTSADQVIDRYEQAIGGHAAWDKLQSMTAKGNLELKGQLSLGGFESAAAVPVRSVAKFMNAGRAILAAGCNGDTCWMFDAKNGLHSLGGDALAAQYSDSDFYSELHLRQRYSNFRMIGTESRGTAQSYVLEASPNPNKFVRFYFDAASGLKTREEITTQDANGQRIVATIYEDYHQTEGVAIPYTVRMSDPELTIHITQVQWNVPIDDSKFAMPSLESLQPPPKLVVAPQSSSSASSVGTAGARDLSPDSGGVTGNVYHNDYFSFTYQFPAGWSVAPAATTDRLMEAGRAMASRGSNDRKLVLDAAAQHTYPMITITRYPFGTPGKINQIIQLVSEDLSYAPGLTQSKDYLDLVTHAVLSVSAGYEVLRDGKAMTFGGRTFYAGELMKPGATTIYQWYVCNVDNGMALTWIFTAPSAATADAQLNSLNSLVFGK